MIKIFKSHIVLENLETRYIAILRLFIWDSGKCFNCDYVYATYDREKTTLKQIHDDAQEMYRSIISEFSADNIN